MPWFATGQDHDQGVKVNQEGPILSPPSSPTGGDLLWGPLRARRQSCASGQWAQGCSKGLWPFGRPRRLISQCETDLRMERFEERWVFIKIMPASASLMIQFLWLLSQTAETWPFPSTLVDEQPSALELHALVACALLSAAKRSFPSDCRTTNGHADKERALLRRPMQLPGPSACLNIFLPEHSHRTFSWNQRHATKTELIHSLF